MCAAESRSGVMEAAVLVNFMHFFHTKKACVFLFEDGLDWDFLWRFWRAFLKTDVLRCYKLTVDWFWGSSLDVYAPVVELDQSYK